MKHKRINDWLTQTMAIITMVLGFSALAEANESKAKHLPLSEAESLARSLNNNEKIAWKITKDRKLTMQASLPLKCKEGGKLEHNEMLTEALNSNEKKNRYVLTLNLGAACQEQEPGKNHLVAKKDNNMDKFFHTVSDNEVNNFSVKIDENFSGEVHICHLKSGGPVSSNLEVIKEHLMGCTAIRITAANNEGKGILAQERGETASRIVGIKELEDKEKNEATQREQAKYVKMAENSLESITYYCSKMELNNAFHELEELARTLDDLNIDFNYNDTKTTLLNAFLDKLEEDVNDLNDLKAAYKTWKTKELAYGTSEEEIKEKFADKALEIVENRIEDADDEGSIESLKEIIEIAADFINEDIDTRAIRKDKKTKIKSLYEKAAKKAAEEGATDTSIALLEKAKKYSSNAGKVKISNAQGKLYQRQFAKCLKKADGKGYQSCNRLYKKVKEHYEDSVEFADNSLDKEDEDELELWNEVRGAQYELFEHSYNVPGNPIPLTGSLKVMSWQAYVQYMQAQQQQAMQMQMQQMRMGMRMGMGMGRMNKPGIGIQRNPSFR